MQTRGAEGDEAGQGEISRQSVAGLRDDVRALHATLGDVLAVLRAIHDALAPRRPRRRAITLQERRLVRQLLPVIDRVKGDQPWLVRELLDDDDAGLQLLLRDVDATTLGKALSRAEQHGVTADGLCVRRDAVEVNVITWKVCAVAA